MEEEQQDMETSKEEQINREEAYHFYSPCYFFEPVIKAFLKCLGHDSSPSTTEQQAQDPPSHAESEMKINEELADKATRSSRALKPPPRPPISSGGGPQINKASS
ncbi:hypothetical protein ACB094_02G122600 [Castanea mollissima]